MHADLIKIEVEHYTPTGMELPDFKEILQLMLVELVKRYPYYKDSWKHARIRLSDGSTMNTKEYLRTRMRQHLVEIETAKDTAELIRQHVNLLNLTAMSLDRTLRQ